MIPCVRVKAGVLFNVIAPGGFALLSAFERAAQVLGHDLTITSGTDGIHSGPEDPHAKGRAYDVRTQGFNAQEILKTVMMELIADATDTATTESGGFVTRYFFGWIENAGEANEHNHFQQRKNVDYPPA